MRFEAPFHSVSERIEQTCINSEQEAFSGVKREEKHLICSFKEQDNSNISPIEMLLFILFEIHAKQSRLHGRQCRITSASQASVQIHIARTSVHTTGTTVCV